MALIKYYNLESRSWEAVSELEDNLQTYLRERHKMPIPLSEQGLQYFLNSLSPTMGLPLEEGSAAFDEGVTPGHNFDILYNRSRKISPWWSVFRKMFGTEVVLKMSAPISIDRYLHVSGFTIKHARLITHAQFNLLTEPLERRYLCHYELLRFFDFYKNKTNKEREEDDLHVLHYLNQDNAHYGTFDGRVETVLTIRKLFKIMNVPLQKDEVIFR